MSKLRNSARDRDCQIRIPGVCNRNPETTVLCHLPGGGMGAKMHDIHAAFGCSACHAVVDGSTRIPVPYNTIMLWFYEGVVRTQQIWLDEGLIK